MRVHRALLPLMIVVFYPAGSHAGPIIDFFKGKPKVDPATRVPALIGTLTNDKDERSRQAAVEELPNYDAKQYPEIYTALIHSLQNDSAVAVRLSAVASLGKLRPVNQEAGYALEQAELNDTSPRVRTAATAAIRTYKVLGYTGGKGADPKFDQSEEPPLASPYDKLPRTKGAKPAAPASTFTVPIKEAPKPAVPVKSDSKPGLFALPSWLGGKDREKELPAPKPTVIARDPKVETPAPPLAVPAVPSDPIAVPALPVAIPPLPGREEVKGPSLEPPK